MLNECANCQHWTRVNCMGVCEELTEMHRQSAHVLHNGVGRFITASADSCERFTVSDEAAEAERDERQTFPPNWKHCPPQHFL